VDGNGARSLSSTVERRGWSLGLTAVTDARVARMSASKRGKPNWARGLSAATDPRIAKNAHSRRGRKRGPYRLRSRPAFLVSADLQPEAHAPYLYLLGLYLGDGSIVSKSSRLEITLDARYPSIIEACAASMRAVHPRGRANLRARGESCVVVNSYGRHWLALFPQHGPGHKHLRSIVLAEWQRDLVIANPTPIMRGLLDSDGSRFDRWVGGTNYPAYEFTNKSDDILDIFCWVADLLGLHYTRPSAIDISIARRRDVAFLDSRIPLKTAPVSLAQ
jgi:hypothetical protein